MATYIRTDSQTDVPLYEHLLVMVAYMLTPVTVVGKSGVWPVV
jgi:hypothetical protein